MLNLKRGTREKIIKITEFLDTHNNWRRGLRGIVIYDIESKGGGPKLPKS